MDEDARKPLIQHTHLALMTFCQAASGAAADDSWAFRQAAEELARRLMRFTPNITVARDEMEGRCTLCGMSLALDMPDQFVDDDGRALILSPAEAQQELKRMIERMACMACGTHTIRVQDEEPSQAP
jgi:hypothetical protein